MQSTWMAKKEDIGKEDRDWYFIDAGGVPLGRLASKVATVLQGKHKPQYTPHVDMGDYVVVVNGSKVELTGNKAEQKFHYRHSGYLGNMSKKSYGELLESNSTIPVKEAVRRMLPKNKLGTKMLKKLKIYPLEENPHGEKEFKELEV